MVHVTAAACNHESRHGGDQNALRRILA
jgi:hypothetical protein